MRHASIIVSVKNEVAVTAVSKNMSFKYPPWTWNVSIKASITKPHVWDMDDPAAIDVALLYIA